jgi:hypothetical protein
MAKKEKTESKKSDTIIKESDSVKMETSTSREVVENTVSKRRFQWIKGDKVGNIEVYKSEKVKGNINFIIFESKNKINSALVNEFMIEIFDDSEILNMSETNTPDKGFNSAPAEKVIEKSPIRLLLEKQKDSSKDKIDIAINLNLPSKDMFNLLMSSFGEDVEKELISLILDDKENLYKILENSIKNYYK